MPDTIYSKMMLVKAVHYFWDIDYKYCNYKKMKQEYTIEELQKIVKENNIDVKSCIKSKRT